MAKKVELKDRENNEVFYPITKSECINDAFVSSSTLESIDPDDEDKHLVTLGGFMRLLEEPLVLLNTDLSDNVGTMPMSELDSTSDLDNTQDGIVYISINEALQESNQFFYRLIYKHKPTGTIILKNPAFSIDGKDIISWLTDPNFVTLEGYTEEGTDITASLMEACECAVSSYKTITNPNYFIDALDTPGFITGFMTKLSSNEEALATLLDWGFSNEVIRNINANSPTNRTFTHVGQLMTPLVDGSLIKLGDKNYYYYGKQVVTEPENKKGIYAILEDSGSYILLKIQNKLASAITEDDIIRL